MLKQRVIHLFLRPLFLLDQSMGPLESHHEGIELRLCRDRLQGLHAFKKINQVEGAFSRTL